MTISTLPFSIKLNQHIALERPDVQQGLRDAIALLNNPRTVFLVFDFCAGMDLTLGVFHTVGEARAFRDALPEAERSWTDIEAWLHSKHLTLYEGRGGVSV